MKKSSKIALGSMLTALSVVLMYFTFFPYFTYTIPAAAGIILIISVIEINKKYSFAVALQGQSAPAGNMQRPHLLWVKTVNPTDPLVRTWTVQESVG